jgi:hypothetical protein
MNERIKELAKQADNYAYKMNPEQDSYGRSANPRKFQQDRDAKFAELIVAECAKVADLADENKCEWIGGNILVHFGVEE